MALTDTQIRATKPTEKIQKLSDGRGLFLWVMPSGTKTWYVHYRVSGKQKQHKLGRYPAVGLGQARKLLTDVKEQVGSGADPQAVQKSTSVPTWNECSDGFMEPQRRRLAAATLRKMERQLALASVAFGDRPVDQIKAPDILPVLEEMERKGATGPYIARTRALFSRVFAWAAQRGHVEADPAALLVGAVKGTKESGYAALTAPEDVSHLMRAVYAYRGEPQVRAGLQTLAHSFLRPGEVRAMEWSDVDLRGALVTIPAERMKMGRDHVVPLSHQMVGILTDLRQWTGNGDLVFPGLRHDGRPLSENVFRSALETAGISRDSHTPHGFRKTASTLLNENGWNRDWIERQLAHVSGDIRGIYNKAEWLNARREMLQAWSDQIDEMVDDLDALLN